MLPILPRQMLWTDKETMDEFFELDPVNKDFYEAFINFMGNLCSIEENAVFIFNEVYYQATRMVYERPLPKQLFVYISDIRLKFYDNNELVELIMTITNFMLSLATNIDKPLNKFFIKEIDERFNDSVFWEPFKECHDRLKCEKRFVTYTFQPCPWSAIEFNSLYVDWNTITQNYDLSAIVHLLRLWPDDAECGVIAKLIQRSMEAKHARGTSQDYDQLIRVLQEAQHVRNMIAQGEKPIEERDRMQEMISQMEKENIALQEKVEELQDKLGEEKVQLSVLAEGIKNYSEEAGIDAAYDLFSHLNNVLCDIPAWMKNVPELRKFFRDSRKEREKSITNIGQQNNFANVGNYNETVATQNNNYPAMPLGQQGQKQLE